MNRLVLGLPLALAVILAVAAPGTASRWTLYGSPIVLKNKPVPIARVLHGPVPSADHEILVRGTVSEVCRRKGCWMTVAAGADTLRVEFKDYGFFVPWASEGKAVRLQGIVRERQLSDAEREHIASESRRGTAAAPPQLRVLVASGVEIQGGGKIGQEQQAIIRGDEGDPEHDHDGHDHHRHE